MSVRTIRNKICIYLFLLLPILSLAGCSKTEKNVSGSISLPVYSKKEYNTVPVKKGDLTPKFKIDLKLRKNRRVNYYPYIENMEIDEVLVSKGQIVNRGDKLIQFKDNGIRESISNYEEELEVNTRLIEHYNRLSMLDKNSDYSSIVETLENDNATARLYINQLSKRLEDYSIFAEDDGVIADISDKCLLEKIGTKDRLITVVYGDGYYEGEVANDYIFNLGDVYTLKEDGLSYDFKVIAFDSKNKMVSFQLMDRREIYNRDFFSLSVDMETRKNVLYIPEYCVHNSQGKQFVYMLNEKGYRYVKEVTVGEKIDGNIIINSGLDETDMVVK